LHSFREFNPSSAHEHGVSRLRRRRSGGRSRLVRATPARSFTSMDRGDQLRIKGAAFAAPARAGQQVVISAADTRPPERRFVERPGPGSLWTPWRTASSIRDALAAVRRRRSS
jgi:hypothetical protein